MHPSGRETIRQPSRIFLPHRDEGDGEVPGVRGAVDGLDGEVGEEGDGGGDDHCAGGRGGGRRMDCESKAWGLCFRGAAPGRRKEVRGAGFSLRRGQSPLAQRQKTTQPIRHTDSRTLPPTHPPILPKTHPSTPWRPRTTARAPPPRCRRRPPPRRHRRRRPP